MNELDVWDDTGEARLKLAAQFFLSVHSEVFQWVFSTRNT